MIKVKVFENNMKGISSSKQRKFKFIPKGYIEIEEFDENKIFNLLNWKSWADEQPLETKNLLLESAGSGILLQKDNEDECLLSLSLGWKKFSCFDEAFKWMRPRARQTFLIDGDII